MFTFIRGDIMGDPWASNSCPEVEEICEKLMVLDTRRDLRLSVARS